MILLSKGTLSRRSLSSVKTFDSPGFLLSAFLPRAVPSSTDLFRASLIQDKLCLQINDSLAPHWRIRQVRELQSFILLYIHSDTPYFCFASAFEVLTESWRKMNPSTNRTASVDTAILTLPVRLTVMPISIVPTKEAPFPQIS